MTVIDTATARARAESLMTSTCRIYTDGAPTMDPETGHVESAENVVWSGSCRVRPASGPGGNSQTGDVAGAQVFSFDYLVSVPFAVVDVAEGQRLTVTDSPDPALVGVTLEIQHVDRGDTLSARRLQCREVV